MVTKKQFELDEAKEIGDGIGIDWSKCDVEQFREGLEIELEHGVRDPTKLITREALLFSGRIAWGHLNENPGFYTRFERIG